jgi:hypothetical protein
MVPDLDNMRPEAAAYLALIAMMQAHSTSATTPAPPDMTVHVTAADLEAQHDQLRAAPVHVQALILDDPAEVLRFGRCTVDASVIRSFRGWDILPAGSLFRLTIPCDPSQNGRVWRDRDTVHEGRVFRGELTLGRIIEAYLDHFGPLRSCSRNKRRVFWSATLRHDQSGIPRSRGRERVQRAGRTAGRGEIAIREDFLKGET